MLKWVNSNSNLNNFFKLFKVPGKINKKISKMYLQIRPWGTNNNKINKLRTCIIDSFKICKVWEVSVATRRIMGRAGRPSWSMGRCSSTEGKYPLQLIKWTSIGWDSTTRLASKTAPNFRLLTTIATQEMMALKFQPTPSPFSWTKAISIRLQRADSANNTFMIELIRWIRPIKMCQILARMHHQIW